MYTLASFIEYIHVLSQILKVQGLFLHFCCIGGDPVPVPKIFLKKPSCLGASQMRRRPRRKKPVHKSGAQLLVKENTSNHTSEYSGLGLSLQPPTGPLVISYCNPKPLTTALPYRCLFLKQAARHY